MRLVYDYKSYRLFLKDCYLSQKNRHPAFSYSVFAKQIGLTSPAHVQLILSGKRNLTAHAIHRVAEALSLPKAELDYFETLVHLNQAEAANEKKFYAERLAQLSPNKPGSSARLKTSFLLSNGLLPALLLSIDGKDQGLAAQAGVNLGYTPDETRKIIQQLLKEDVICLKDEQTGTVIRLSQRHLILHDKKARSQAQKNFLAKQLRLSSTAFETMYELEGKFFAHTFTIHPETLSLYVDQIKALIEKMTHLSDEQVGDQVMQLNVQLFPYAKSLIQPHLSNER
ncbi:MAG: hypothetical protein A2X94_11585 [Bdellovibrionales bacterium GWB1_55_8]|nr:MAG: hypothetical protein A2X94_11585 [Bdellovibrionales bacterium GWB1_55_8]